MIKVRTLVITMLLSSLMVTSYAQNSLRNDSLIVEAISRISYDSIEYQLQWLQDMGTRFMMAPNHKNVAEQIKARFESYGISEVRLDSFECYTDISYGILEYDTTTWQYNVEAKIIGSLYPDEEIVLMGHYDNVQINTDPEVFTPGADDNASGTVAALETARVIMDMGFQPERTIVFLATGAEELMNFGDAGSEHYAAEAETTGRNLWGVINNDMIAYDEGSGIITLSNVIGSEEITGVAELITNAYTSLEPLVEDPTYNAGADLKPFINAGYHGVYLMENNFNPYYHSEFDLVENCDLNYLTEAIKISTGMVIYTDMTVGIDDPDFGEIIVSAFPNPCNNILNIALSGNDNSSQLLLFNTSGQKVFSSEFMGLGNTITIDMTNYPAGVYILNIYNESGIIKHKVIKQ